jgi:hypothetical protein
VSAGASHPFDRAALQRVVVALGTEAVERRVAGAAMTEAVDEVTPARDVGRLRGRRCGFRTRMQVQKIPDPDDRPEAEREDQVVMWRASVDGRAAH